MGVSRGRAALAALLAAFVPVGAWAQDEPAPETGAVVTDEAVALEEAYPDLLETTLSVEGDIAEADTPRTTWFRQETALGGWFAAKRRFQERTGLSFGGSWGVLYQSYSHSLTGEDESVGSKLTLNLSYPLINRGQANALNVDMAIEDRRPLFTDLAPLQAGLRTGSAVPTAATWGEFDLGITQFYVHQNLAGNRFQYTVGKIFAPNFVNPYPFFDDNRQFLSLPFSTSPTIAVPLRGFGAVVAAYPVRNLYVKAGMFTAHSDDTGITIDDFFSKGEHFYFVEAGYSGVARRGLPIHARGPMDRDNAHVTAWYRDEIEGAAIPSPRAYGFAFNANFMAGDNMMWFVRGGWSDGWLADLALSGGIGIRPPGATSDLFGVGLGWVNPANDLLRDQYTAEIFYRFHFTQNLAFTPNVQVVFNPTLAPSRENVLIGSFRTRLTF